MSDQRYLAAYGAADLKHADKMIKALEEELRIRSQYLHEVRKQIEVYIQELFNGIFKVP